VHVVDISSRAQPPQLLAELAAHRAPVLAVAWSEDESRLASCDKKGVVVLWDAVQEAPPGQEGDSSEALGGGA